MYMYSEWIVSLMYVLQPPIMPSVVCIINIVQSACEATTLWDDYVAFGKRENKVLWMIYGVYKLVMEGLVKEFGAF